MTRSITTDKFYGERILSWFFKVYVDGSKKRILNKKMNLFAISSIFLKVTFLVCTATQFLEFLLYAVLVSLSAEKKEG